MNIAEYSIKNRLIVAIVIVGSLLTGWIAYSDMPRFEDPEYTIRTAEVITQYPGGSAHEVANEVTALLESEIQQLQEVQKIHSTSSAGLSRVTVDIKFEFSTSKEALQAVWTKLRNKVDDAARQLPPGASVPFVDDSFGDVFGLYYLITGEGFSARELYDYARTLRTDLLAVPGVAKVAISGKQQEAVYVEIARDRAAALGVSPGQIYADLAKQNSVVSSGDMLMGNQRLIVRPSGMIESSDEIGDTIITGDESGSIIRLSDVATVRRDYTEKQDLQIRHDGQQAIAIGISNVTGVNVVEMGHAIERRLAEVAPLRPVGMQLHENYHQGKLVDAAVKDFAFNVGVALAIVLVTLLVFMGLNSALVIGGLLLITVAATLGTMHAFGIPMHRISLGALIIALGMLVDNAIVVTEGILVGVKRGLPVTKAAKDIVGRTIWPLLGGTVVGVLAFAPVGFAAGSTAEYTGDLFWVVMISLLFSWVFAITLVPVFADLLFKDQPGTGSDQARPSLFERGFRTVVSAVLRFRWPVVAIVTGLFAASVWGLGSVKDGFFPASTTPQIVMEYELPEGTDLNQTRSDLLTMEGLVQQMAGVESVQTLIGGSALRYTLVYNLIAPSPSYGQLIIKVEDYQLIDALLPKIQASVDTQFPAAQAKVWRFQLGPGDGSKIEAAFSGPDPSTLRQLANQAKAIMAADDRAITIKDNWRQETPIVQPRYSEAQGRRLGISREDLANSLARNLSGTTVGVYREGEDLLPIIARAPAEERVGSRQLASMQISSPVTGGSVPLLSVVDSIGTEWENPIMRRYNRVWTIKAQADPADGELTGNLFQRLRPQIEAIPLPAGYRLWWDGEYGDSTEAQDSLAATLPLGLAAMVLTVIFLFNALRQALVIWLVVPLALIGVVIGLLSTGTPMEFMAILGVLSLSGLLIKNAIVLVDQMDLEIAEGKPRFDAIVDSASSRVRPVMMGSLTTVLGVIPLLFDAFFKSMAVVLIYGLTFATLLTLIVVPALYAIVFGVRNHESKNSPGVSNE